MATHNLFVGVGKLVNNAELLSTPKGRPFVRFRMEIPGDPHRPRKVPLNDYQTVVAYGERFAPLAEYLVEGQEVLVIGWAQSRDLPDGRVVNEIGAENIAILATPALVNEITEVLREAMTNGDAHSLLARVDNLHPVLRCALQAVLGENADNN